MSEPNTAKNHFMAYLDLCNKKPSVWAEEHGISPATMTRLLRGDSLSYTNYERISKATGEVITIQELREMKSN